MYVTHSFYLRTKKNSYVSAGPPGWDFFFVHTAGQIFWYFIFILFSINSWMLVLTNPHSSCIELVIVNISPERLFSLTHILNAHLESWFKRMKKNGNAPDRVSIFLPTRPGGNTTIYFSASVTCEHCEGQSKSLYLRSTTLKVRVGLAWCVQIQLIQPQKCNQK